SHQRDRQLDGEHRRRLRDRTRTTLRSALGIPACLAHRATEPRRQNRRGLSHRHPRVQQCSGRVDPPGELPSINTTAPTEHDIRILPETSQLACDTPRPFKSSITQRDIEAEVAHCVGDVISPLLANVYLHYVFDLWADWWRRHRATG